jgi:F-type H+-transporting ATPase subunit delta
MSTRVANTYAAALLELAAETDSVAEVGADLSVVAEGLVSDPDTAAFLGSARIGRAAKRAMLERTLAGAVEGHLYSLLMLLVRRGRLRYLGAIAEAYRSMEEAARGIQHVTVSSASELGAGEVDRIRRSLQERLGKSVILDTRVDPSLIAGVRVQSEGMEYELSVDGLLRGLKARLLARTRQRAV